MNRLTATLITLNEEQNLPCALESLQGLPDEVIVVDSGSADRTCQIALAHGARVLTHAWTNFAEQRNFAAVQATTDWILALDADEELSPELRASLKEWKARPPAVAAYEFSRKARYLGAWIRHSGWYPDRKTRLYRRDLGRFSGVAHDSLQVQGPVERLRGDLYHHAFQTFAQHTAKVNSYSTVAAHELYAAGRRSWLPALLLATPWAFFRRFFLQAGFLDGYRGWLIARMGAKYVFLKYRKLGRLVRGEGQLSGPAAGEARS